MTGDERWWIPVRHFSVLFLIVKLCWELNDAGSGRASFPVTDVLLCGCFLLGAVAPEPWLGLRRRWRQRHRRGMEETAVDPARGFVIPEEFRDIPEAVEVRRLDAEFGKSCEVMHEAVKAGLWRTAREEFEALDRDQSRLHRELRAAREAFDHATGEPKPLALPPDVVEAIDSQFPKEEGKRVTQILAKTMAHLERYWPGNPRVTHCILKLAAGDVARVEEVAALARIDFRDVIVAADGMPRKKDASQAVG